MPDLSLNRNPGMIAPREPVVQRQLIRNTKKKKTVKTRDFESVLTD